MGEAKAKREQFKAHKTCVYCGVQCKPTMDHVPPKGIFPPPRPQILITVPACQDCNEQAAGIDEAFKTAIALQVDPRLNAGNAALARSGQATLRKNRRLGRELLSGGRRILVERQGVLVPTKEFLWPARYHDEVIERITRGLYFHETGNSLFDLKCDVEAFYHGRDAKELPELAHTMNIRSVGVQQFAYSFGIAGEDPKRSVWIYEFYETHYASAHTFPKGDPDVVEG